MATGYDNRQPTGQTFAFQPAAPAQVQARNSGQSRGAQVVGGQSAGGAVAAGPQTDAAPVAAGLGAFVEQVMRPHIERRQHEEFFKGFAEAQSGVAVEEIAKSHGGFSKIFGPTAYLQGAEFYTAKKHVDDWTQQNYADMDTLKKLPPDELSKVLADKSQSLMTGDPFANHLIQSSLMEATGPLVSAISKERYAWQQSEAKNAATSSWSASAKTLQSASVAQASLAAPSDGESAAYKAQAQSFLAGMAKPHGMDDETYRKGLYDFMRGALQDGSFYAVKLMRSAGIDKVFSEDEQVKLADAERRYGDRTLEDFTSRDRGFSKLVRDYDERRAHTEGGDKKSLSGLEAAQSLAAINAYVRERTGIDRDIFDFKDIRGEVRSINSLFVAAWKRAQDRAWQVEDRKYEHAMRERERQQDLHDTAVAAGVAWASGDVNAAEIAGIEGRHFERLALRDFRNGDLTALARAFRVSHYVADGVRNQIAGAVAGSIGEQYGTVFAAAHKQWSDMAQASPGMAAAYYGDMNEKMRAFDTLSRSIKPVMAYERVFDPSATFNRAPIPASVREAAEKAIDGVIADMQPSWRNLWGRQKLSANGVRVLKGAISDRVARNLQNSDAGAAELVPEAALAVRGDGTIQSAGGEVWRTPARTKPFASSLGLQQDEADTVFRSIVDKRLKQAGFAKGIGGSLEVAQIKHPNGSDVLLVVGHDGEGDSRHVLIAFADFRDAARKRIQNEVRANQPPPAQTQAHETVEKEASPYRRIKGEKGWQRVVRINREVAAGSKATH